MPPNADDAALEALLAKRARGELFTPEDRATLETLASRSDDGFFNFEAGVEARIATEANGAQRFARFVADVNTNEGPNAQAELGAAKEMGLRSARRGAAAGAKGETFARTSTTGENGIALVDEAEVQRGPFGVAVGEERGLAGNVKDKSYVEAFAHVQPHFGAHEAELKAYVRAEVTNDADTRRAVAARMALKGNRLEEHGKRMHAEQVELRKKLDAEEAAKKAAAAPARSPAPWEAPAPAPAPAGPACSACAAVLGFVSRLLPETPPAATPTPYGYGGIRG